MAALEVYAALKSSIAFILTLFILNGCANHVSMTNGREFYFVYFGSVYMKLDKTNENSVYPWVLEEFESDQSNDGVILVSHSCGFFDVDLKGFKLAAIGNDISNIQDETLRVSYSGGEFCNISGLLSYAPKLVKVKVWKGKYFALDYWEVSYIGDDKLILFDSYDIEDIGVSSSYRVLDFKQSREACEKIDYLSPKELRVRLRAPNIVQVNDEICYTKGVFLHEIINL